MARAPSKAASAALAKAAASAVPEGEARFVRLLGIASRVGGKTLPIGAPLRVGVDIPAALAEARLQDKTAEAVLPTDLSAQRVREAFTAVCATARAQFDAAEALVAAATLAELAEAATGALLGRADETVKEGIDALQAAIEAHEAALAAVNSGDGTETPPGGSADGTNGSAAS